MEGIQQSSMEYKISDNLLILSCEQDYEACVPFLDKGMDRPKFHYAHTSHQYFHMYMIIICDVRVLAGAAVYSSELLLNGIIIQKLEYVR